MIARPRLPTFGHTPATTRPLPATDHSNLVFQWLACLADPTRVRLLRLLERDELGVTDLCAVVQMPQSTVSRHLKVLTDEGWVTHRRVGTNHLYHMVHDELTPVQRDLWRLARDNMKGWATLAQDQVRLAGRLAASSGRSRAFFATAAGQWDRTRAALFGATLDTDVLTALLPAHWSVADFGCGTGALAVRLARQVHRVVGVDNSPEMLAVARAHAEQAGVTQSMNDRNGTTATLTAAGVSFVEVELHETGLPDRCLDAALGVLVLSYVSDPVVVLEEMRRVLKPDAPVVVVDLLSHDRDDFRRQMNHQTNGFSPEVLHDLLKDAGFTGVHIDALPPDPDATAPALLLARATVPHQSRPTVAAF